MDNRELVAYAVDADTGEITWRLYNEPWKSGKESNVRVFEGK